MRKRDKSIAVRMTQKEYDHLQKQLALSGQTKQAFVINAIEGAMITTPTVALELKKINITLAELLKQLRGMATNINQLAHRANGYRELPTVEKLEEISGEINGFREEASVIWQSIRQLLSHQKHTVE
ncbi:MAG: plasmid mobilization relaxosome protein MobC [Lachnospiraceae bacterium]|nr:plasmid mobilization relaxosome protein MobC [Lachnospiraceae bacterium]